MNHLRFALRQLLKNPGFTAVTVLTLALGIGATTALFSVVNTVLLKPLPLPQSERVVSVWERGPGGQFGKTPASAQNYLDWKARAKSFHALTCWQPLPANVGAEGGTPERWNAASVHEDFFQVAGVSPRVGNPFRPEHFRAGTDAVVILGEGVWQERFGGDPAILGKTLTLNGVTRTIIGVMPAGFQTPGQARVWLPKVFSPQVLADRGHKHLYVLGRLADGVTVEQANREVAGIAAQIAAEFPAFLNGWDAFAHPVLEDVAQPTRLPLLVLSGAVGVVLLMACVNVANLLLARSSARLGEMSLRVALGARRRHLVQQLGLESLLLALLGGSAGWLLAGMLLKLVVSAAPAGLPRIQQVSLDLPTLAFTLGASVVTAFLFGFAPAWRLLQVQPVQAIRDSSDQTTARTGKVGQSLVVFQIAAAMVLLVAAGLLMRSFAQLMQEDLGFRPDELLTVRLELPRAKYGDAGRRGQFAAALLEKLAAVPGVTSVAVTSQLPLQGWPQLITRVEGRPTPQVSEAPTTGYSGVSPDYFRTLGITILRGRGFAESDRAGSALVCVVNEAFARKFFPQGEGLGQRIEVGFDQPPRWLEIVGISHNTRNQSLEAQPQEEVFVPFTQQLDFLGPALSVAIRTRPGTPDLAGALRETVWSIDRDQPLHNLKPMRQVLVEATAQRRFTLLLLGAFSGLALVLTLVGLYGVLAYAVSQRRREIGIRMALGAHRGTISRLILQEGFRLAAFGLVIGWVGTFGVTRVMRSLLYGVTPTDPLTLGAVTLVLAAVALLACFIPARRAARVDPLVALRNV
jgi:putative ABC transport system permease protein